MKAMCELGAMRISWLSFNVRPHLQSHSNKKFDKFCQKHHCNRIVGVMVFFVFRRCNKDTCRKKTKTNIENAENKLI